LTQAYLAAVIALPEYQRRRQELDGKIQALATQAQQLDAQVDHHAQLAGRVTSITAFCQRVRTGLTHAMFQQTKTHARRIADQSGCGHQRRGRDPLRHPGQSCRRTDSFLSFAQRLFRSPQRLA